LQNSFSIHLGIRTCLSRRRCSLDTARYLSQWPRKKSNAKRSTIDEGPRQGTQICNRHYAAKGLAVAKDGARCANRRLSARKGLAHHGHRSIHRSSRIVRDGRGVQDLPKIPNEMRQRVTRGTMRLFFPEVPRAGSAG